jgi:hypothetical protein
MSLKALGIAKVFLAGDATGGNATVSPRDGGINKSLASGLLKLERTTVPSALAPAYTWEHAVRGATDATASDDRKTNTRISVFIFSL